MKRTSLTVMAVCAMLLWVGAAQAKTAPTLVCERSKLKANGVLEACLATNRANVLAGEADKSAACETNFTKALEKADKAATKAKTSCRYVNNADGTVSDLDTALMWEQTTGTIGTILAEPPATDVNNLYYFDRDGDNLADGTAFTSFLATLNNGASTDGAVGTPITGCFANHCDWRLPSIAELQGIFDPSGPGCATKIGPGPCVDPIFGPTQTGSYWSATTEADFPDTAWGMVFEFDAVDNLEKAGTNFVRAVRSGL